MDMTQKIVAVVAVVALLSAGLVGLGYAYQGTSTIENNTVDTKYLTVTPGDFNAKDLVSGLNAATYYDTDSSSVKTDLWMKDGEGMTLVVLNDASEAATPDGMYILLGSIDITIVDEDETDKVRVAHNIEINATGIDDSKNKIYASVDTVADGNGALLENGKAITIKSIAADTDSTADEPTGEYTIKFWAFVAESELPTPLTEITHTVPVGAYVIPATTATGLDLPELKNIVNVADLDIKYIAEAA